MTKKRAMQIMFAGAGALLVTLLAEEGVANLYDAIWFRGFVYSGWVSAIAGVVFLVGAYFYFAHNKISN